MEAQPLLSIVVRLHQEALLSKEHRQLPTDQQDLSRGTLDVFFPYPMVRLVQLGKCATIGGALAGCAAATAQASGTIHCEKSKENRNDAKGY